MSLSRRATIAIVAAFGVTLVGVPSALSGAFSPGSPSPDGASALGRAPITKVPADEPERGMVYKGLKAAKKGTPCVGGYETADRNTCSHGPDAAPPGLDVTKAVKPVAASAAAPRVPARDPVADEATVIAETGATGGDGTLALVPDAAPPAAVEVGPHGVVCDGDGTTGKRVQVLYAYAAGTASRYAQYLASFRTWAAGVDTIYNASAQETGGVRHLRYVTTADCQVVVDEVEVPAGAMDTFSATITALKARGYNRTDRKYMIFGESRVYCGIGSFAGDDRPGAVNRSNGGPSYGRSDSGCWNAGVAAHELGHNLGAVNNSAPNSSRAGHCVDEYDVMCYKDTASTVLRTVCPNRAQDQRLDCNHDDYYHTDPSPGSYLATRWNMADSDFLLRGDGGPGPTPSPSTSPTRSPTPSPSVSPTRSPTASPSPSTSPTPTASPTPTGPPTPTPTPTDPGPDPDPGLKPLTVGEVTTTSARLSWPAATGSTRFGVVVNGRTLGWTRSTAVRIIGLRPATSYEMAVVTRGGPYTQTVQVRTADTAAPPANGWFRLANALTGGVAELYGARAADGTPVVLRTASGTANQLWQLVPAGDGYRLRSKATDKCVAARGAAAAGAPLVQTACGDAALTFTPTRTANGFALTAGDLVAGLGRSRYGAGRLLVLQRPADARHQSWTAVPG